MNPVIIYKQISEGNPFPYLTQTTYLTTSYNLYDNDLSIKRRSLTVTQHKLATDATDIFNFIVARACLDVPVLQIVIMFSSQATIVTLYSGSSKLRSSSPNI